MGIFTPDVNNLRELYLSELQRALNSEKQIVEKGLPAMIEKSTSPELAQAFRDHLSESKQHIIRLERILDAAQGEVNESKCKVTAALISSAESEIGDAANGQIRDVILIAAGNQVEHHEIAVYGTLRTGPKSSATSRTRSSSTKPSPKKRRQTRSSRSSPSRSM
jgi:ferritin-like metal-binding protein YciE